MITLYAFGPFFDLPDASPYVMKTEIQLRMAGLAYEKDFSGFATAPKGKLPYIRDNDVLVADSTFIRAYLERTRRFDLDAHLDQRQRAEAWATERMLEDHLAWTNTHFRWIVRENFDKGPAQFFDHAPEEMREKLREDVYARVKQTMWGVGMGRHAEDEILALATKSLAALSAILADKPWLMGENPCGADATAIGVFAGILTPYFDTKLRRAAQEFDNLAAYVDRGMREFYPEHAWRTPGKAIELRAAA